MTTRLTVLLGTHRDRIVSRFVAEVQLEALSPPGVAPPLLVDHIPKVLDEIVVALTFDPSGDAVDPAQSWLARRHGEQRWSLGYDLRGLIREYGVLRRCIVLIGHEVGSPLSGEDLEALGECLNAGLATAAEEYARFRDAELLVQKGNLEFLAEAGRLLSSSLDSRKALAQLTTLIVPRLADWCSVHVEGVSIEALPIAHVEPVKAEQLRDMHRRFPLPKGTREARVGQLLRELNEDALKVLSESDEHGELLRATGFRSGLVLPLGVEGHTFGVLLLAYGDSGRQYDEADLGLAAELARRASVAIDNARLYELSQSERSRAEAATRAKDEFVAMVSHELRTPLNVMLGWLRLMRGGPLPESKREHALDVIERNAHAQDRLVADLLDISRIMAGKIRINPSQVELSNLVDMAVEGMRPAADAKRIQLEVVLDRDVVMRGDGDRLQQIVWNLLANAVKFTPKGGKIVVRLRRVDSDVELVVEDNGEGIPPSFVPHVFGNFLQSDTSTSRRHGGLGVGLSIVKHIVELHGGAASAESAGPGKGATFRVRLPIGPLVSTTLGVARVPAAQTTDAVAADERTNAPGVKVLVVDDDPDARDLISYLFEASGMEVRCAASAADALAELETYTPHVIVSDIGMPGGDGYFLIRRVRTFPDESKRGIPAIALTAFVRNEDRTRALVEGFNAHMAKPVEPTALVNAVIALAESAR